LACTATATARVATDVKKILNIPHAISFRSSFNRPNLVYDVRLKTGADKNEETGVANDIAEWLVEHKMEKQSGTHSTPTPSTLSATAERSCSVFICCCVSRYHLLRDTQRDGDVGHDASQKGVSG
jgi:superfamily II DNA helicase RecQ